MKKSADKRDGDQRRSPRRSTGRSPEDVVVVLSTSAIKRVPMTSYRKQKRGLIGAEVKEKDFIE
jgi:DNA gyrase/topoisomerase IV subunit A